MRARKSSPCRFWLCSEAGRGQEWCGLAPGHVSGFGSMESGGGLRGGGAQGRGPRACRSPRCLPLITPWAASEGEEHAESLLGCRGGEPPQSEPQRPLITAFHYLGKKWVQIMLSKKN